MLRLLFRNQVLEALGLGMALLALFGIIIINTVLVLLQVLLSSLHHRVVFILGARLAVQL